MTQILQAAFTEETLGALEEELMMKKSLQNLFQVKEVGLQGIAIDEDIVEEDRRKLAQEWL